MDLRKNQDMDTPYQNVASMTLSKLELYYMHTIYEIKMTYTDGTEDSLIRVSGECGLELCTKLFSALEAKIKQYAPKAKIRMKKL